MQILSVVTLAIPSVRVVRFGKFVDHRGYFTEPYRKNDLWGQGGLQELANLHVVQSNEITSGKFRTI